MKLEVGSLEETVNVSAESPLVDVTSKEIGGNITSETLVQLPSVNGNFIGFVGLLPGIVPSISTESFGSDSISVNGQDPRNNNYMLDGGNNNDDVIGQRAGTQARTPIEAIQEFQVVTDQFDAEFGRTAGAIINAVTKQGTNRMRGSAFGYFQRGDLTEKDFFAKEKGLAKPDTKYDRWGGTVGGPIVKDKLHYFASLERFSIDRPNTINIPARPDLNATHADRRPGVEHDRPGRSSGQRQQHLQRSLAARDLAAAESDHRSVGDAVGHAGVGARGIRRRPDAVGQRQLGAVPHEGEHPAIDLDARERGVRQPLLQHQRPRPVEVPAVARCSRTSSISRTTRRSRASTTASRSRRRSPGSCPASTATTTSSSAHSTSTPAPPTPTRAT